MGPQDPRDAAKTMARDLTGIAGELATLKADGARWLEGPEYEALRLRLEIAHAAVESALVEARRRVRLDGGRKG